MRPPTSLTLLERRFVGDYARNPVNLLLLVLVPVVFVVAAAGSMADAAALLGGSEAGAAVSTVTAGWAAGFLAGIAMYFQTSAARDVDRRLVLSGLRPARMVAARLAAGLALAAVASAALASLPDGRTPTKRDWARLARSWQPRIDEQIALLERLRSRLDGCIGCGCLSLQACQLDNPADVAAVDGPGPRYLLADPPATPPDKP